MINMVQANLIILDKIDDLRNININAKVIIICNPNNPCGYIYNTEEMELIANYAGKMDSFIISDEIYERIDYNNKHQSMAKYYNKDKVFTINGFSKIYSMMGYRLGYVACSNQYINQLIKIQSQITSCPCSISQAAGIAALKLPDSVINSYINDLLKKRDYICEIFNIPKTDGGIYVFIPNIDYKKLLHDHNIAVMPGSAFGYPESDNYVRICYSQSWDDLKLFENLKINI